MAAGVGVRSVTSGGRRLVEVVAAAFAEDPWMRWTLPSGRAIRSLTSLFLRVVAFEVGRVFVAGDPVIGVAVLVPPNARPPQSHEVGEMVIALHGDMAGPALDADAVVDRFRPDVAHWRLHTLAVHPAEQHRGAGSGLLEACRHLAAPDRIHLETSSAAARDWYLRRGFEVTATVALPDHGLPAGAPTVWLLADSPAGQRPGG